MRVTVTELKKMIAESVTKNITKEQFTNPYYAASQRAARSRAPMPTGDSTGGTVSQGTSPSGDTGRRMAPYEFSPNAGTVQVPSELGDNARKIWDNVEPTALASLVSRMSRLLERGQETEIAQILTWITQGATAAQTRASNMANYARSSNVGALRDPNYKNKIVAWATRARAVAATLSRALPPNVEAMPAGSPERQQLIQTLRQINTQLVERLGREWGQLESDFSRIRPENPEALRAAGRPQTVGMTGAQGQTVAVPVNEIRKMIRKALAEGAADAPTDAGVGMMPRPQRSVRTPEMPRPAPTPTNEIRRMVREIIEEMIGYEGKKELDEVEELKEAVRKVVRAELKRSAR
jgi:hypothetical protein